MPFQEIVTNLSGVVRRGTIADRQYVVAPMVMLTEGVHEGNNGPLYYPAEELSKAPMVWNHKPIVVYHPVDGGTHVSACSPEMLTRHQIGLIMNTQWDDEAKKLRGEAWLEESRLKLIDPRVYDALQKNDPVEVSTGLFTSNEAETGEWNGEEYVGVARDYKPDHLAVLPDQVGACSVADGAGLLQVNESNRDRLKKTWKAIEDYVLNEKSHEQLRDELWAKVRKEYGDSWVTEVYDDYLIYELGGKLYRLSYTVGDDGPVLGDSPEKVERVVEYRTAATVNSSGSVNGEGVVDKKKVVDGLIANKASGWAETDRKTLMGMPDESLKKIVANVEAAEKAAEKPEGEKTGDEKPPEKTGDEKPAEKDGDKAGEKPTANKSMSAAEFWAAAPPEIKNLISNAKKTEERERQRLISTITANGNVPEDRLKEYDTEVLRDMAALARPPAGDRDWERDALNYSGMGFPSDPLTANTALGEDDGLDLPSTRPTINSAEGKDD